MFVLPGMTAREEVDRLLRQGCRRGDIARRLGVARSTVSYHARRLGAAMDASAARRYDWSEIQSYYAGGHSVRECRKRFGFGSSTWSEAVQRGDVVPRSSAMSIQALLAAPRGRAHVKGRLVKAGLLESSCQSCGITDWQDEPLPLELHHINGIGRTTAWRIWRCYARTATARPTAGAGATAHAGLERTGRFECPRCALRLRPADRSARRRR